eukprot:PITA_36249
MGFASSFINLIRACISGPWITPLVNGRPGPAFQYSRGLRQGCPLSPYLFILKVESFSCTLDHKQQAGLITRIKFEDGVKNINHSQFADDTMLIGGASAIIARRFKTILDKFMRYYGGMINHLKSCIYGWNASAQTLQNISNIFGVSCKLNWDHFNYLGMPVSMGHARAEIWETTLDKLKRKVQKWGSTWLNPAGRLVLLKSGLSSLPLYQFSLVQVPASFHHKMVSILRYFLWQDGKNEKKKYNLVSWKQVIQSQEKGGLGIRSPMLTNLAFGGKIVWRLLEARQAYWKKVIEAKYLNNPRQQLLTSEIPVRSSTSIWKLYKKAISFMAQNVSKVPKDGSKINIGVDNIMGSQAISSRAGWKGWSFPPIPDNLNENFNNFQIHLHSIAPIIKNGNDGFRWDPTGSNYSIQVGYQYFCNRDHSTPPWTYWKAVWKSKAIPKAKETIQHLFISCPFAISCWKSIAPNNTFSWNPQHSIGEVLSNWKKSYPWQPKKNNISKRVWDALPYVLLWKIWIARNHKVFRDRGTLTRQLCSKAKSLAIETIATKSIKNIDMANLYIEERDFIRNLREKSSILPSVNTYSNLINTLSHNWKIRLKKDEFNVWICNNNSYTLFFDGASKSNLGVAGVRGVIYTPNGEPLVTFEWGLGNLSNNRAEALALYQGLYQIQIHGIRKVLIFGDSAIIISLMNSKRKASNICIHQLINGCQTMIIQSWDLKIFHILRTLNRAADKLASQACIRTKGNILCNNEDFFQHLP